MDNVENLVPTMLGFCVALVLFFTIPSVSNGELIQSGLDTYVIHETDVLGDQVCKDGYLSQEMYAEYLETLADTDILYDVTMTAVHDTWYPVYDDTGNFTGEMARIEEKTYTEDIREALSQGERCYYLKKGDRFSISVQSRSARTVQQLLKAIGFRNLSGITAFGGGTVTDENY